MKPLHIASGLMEDTLRVIAETNKAAGLSETQIVLLALLLGATAGDEAAVLQNEVQATLEDNHASHDEDGQ